MVSGQNADIADNLQLRVMGYNYRCVIANDILFDSRGRFSGSSYSMKTAEIECLRVVAMATNFGTNIAISDFM